MCSCVVDGCILSPCTGVLERNEAKFQQMVAEELARIVQSELVELRQRNIAEATTRVRLENQLGELKVVKIATTHCAVYYVPVCECTSMCVSVCVSSVLGGALLST